MGRIWIWDIAVKMAIFFWLQILSETKVNNSEPFRKNNNLSQKTLSRFIYLDETLSKFYGII